MNALDDLTTAFGAVKQAVSDAVSKIHELVSALGAANHNGDDAAIEAIAAQMKDTATTLEAAVNPPAAADPAPAPAAEATDETSTENPAPSTDAAQ